MKSLFNLALLVAAIGGFYLYSIRDTMTVEMVMQELEERMIAVDRHAEKIAALEFEITQAKALREKDAKAIKFAQLKKDLLTAKESLSYNQRVRRQEAKRLTEEELALFDVKNILPFERQIEALELSLEEMPVYSDDSLTQRLESLREAELKAIKTLNRLIIKRSFIFFSSADIDGSVSLEGGKDKYGRIVQPKDQLKTISNQLFGQSSPTKEQVESFVSFHLFWCEEQDNKPESLCDFEWLNNEI